MELNHSSILIEYNDPYLTCLHNYEEFGPFFWMLVGTNYIRPRNYPFAMTLILFCLLKWSLIAWKECGVYFDYFMQHLLAAVRAWEPAP